MIGAGFRLAACALWPRRRLRSSASASAGGTASTSGHQRRCARRGAIRPAGGEKCDRARTVSPARRGAGLAPVRAASGRTRARWCCAETGPRTRPCPGLAPGDRLDTDISAGGTRLGLNSNEAVVWLAVSAGDAWTGLRGAGPGSPSTACAAGAAGTGPTAATGAGAGDGTGVEGTTGSAAPGATGSEGLAGSPGSGTTTETGPTDSLDTDSAGDVTGSTAGGGGRGRSTTGSDGAGAVATGADSSLATRSGPSSTGAGGSGAGSATGGGSTTGSAAAIAGRKGAGSVASTGGVSVLLTEPPADGGGAGT